MNVRTYRKKPVTVQAAQCGTERAGAGDEAVERKAQ